MSTGEPRVPPIVSVVAQSNTGKTTFLEALLPALKEKRLRVAVVKHHHHTSSFDTPGKDTHRIAEAGADLVLGISPARVAKLSNAPTMTPQQRKRSSLDHSCISASSLARRSPMKSSNSSLTRTCAGSRRTDTCRGDRAMPLASEDCIVRGYHREPRTDAGSQLILT